MDGQRDAPAVLSPGNNTGAYRTGDLVGPRAGWIWWIWKRENFSLLTVQHLMI